MRQRYAALVLLATTLALPAAAADEPVMQLQGGFLRPLPLSALTTGQCMCAADSDTMQMTTISVTGHGDGTNCSAGSFPLGVDASGNAQSCGDDITGNAATATVATALAANGTNCVGGNFPAGIDAAGNVESCQTSILGNAGTATALAADGFNCMTGQFPLGIDESGNAQNCSIDINGNAGTATALAANGANCSAGHAAAGVDASGAAESCAPLGTVMADCGAANQMWYDAAASGTTTPTCSSAKVSAAGTITLPDTEELKWTTDLCFERSASNELTISTNCAGTRANVVAAQLALGGTTTPNGLLAVHGPNNDWTNGPHIEQHVASVASGPVLQVLAADGASRIIWGGYWGYLSGFGYYSTNATANFVLGQSGDNLSFVSSAGVATGAGSLGTTTHLSIDAGDGTVMVGGNSATTDIAKMARILKDSVTVDIGNVAGGGCDEPAGLAITVTGAVDGDPCFMGATDDVFDSLRLTFQCYVSAANTVQVKICNVGTTGTNPPSGTYTVVVFRML